MCALDVRPFESVISVPEKKTHTKINVVVVFVATAVIIHGQCAHWDYFIPYVPLCNVYVCTLFLFAFVIS